MTWVLNTCVDAGLEMDQVILREARENKSWIGMNLDPRMFVMQLLFFVATVTFDRPWSKRCTYTELKLLPCNIFRAFPRFMEVTHLDI